MLCELDHMRDSGDDFTSLKLSKIDFPLKSHGTRLKDLSVLCMFSAPLDFVRQGLKEVRE